MSNDTTREVGLNEGLGPCAEVPVHPREGRLWANVRPVGAATPVPGYPLDALYDQAALDAALNLWPRDCRLCAHFTTKSGGCTSLVQCVDSMQFKATAPRQYWIAGPNVGTKLPSAAIQEQR